ncbi:ATP-binding protein [Streptomyces sp. 5-8]|uniref:ATP-binding protein n=1 Tax=Streptomyces musisoli TaxID=2802280 RepID=A0ABS1NWZ4_9ACTN|nr:MULTISPECIES: ATP-binding protein [Streptomyces]MBL1104642.1 ATP-binding protein [Streptomyces musisoli]MBY8846111.1 ATP-binding protein [Streptomyces sp. SP2-10]
MTTTAPSGPPALHPLTGPVPGYAQTLPLCPSSVAVARMSVRTTMACWDLEGMTDDVVLVVSELVTNAVQHARPAGALPEEPGWCRLTLEHPEPGTVWVSVADLSRRRVVRREPGDDAESGRGLAVVDGLATRWLAQSSRTGKTVWAELRADA